MAKPGDMPDLARLGVDDDDTEDLFASPESRPSTQKTTPSTTNLAAAHKQRQRSQSELRETRLKAELERLQQANRAIESAVASLQAAKANMETVDRTVDSASVLLSTWTRILSQTEHNQRLILNRNWHGATRDMEDMENEELRRQQAAERRAMEEQRREEEARQRAEDEARRKAAATPISTRGARGKLTRHASTSSRGNIGSTGQAGRGRGSSTARGTVGNTRYAPARGRARGLG